MSRMNTVDLDSHHHPLHRCKGESYCFGCRSKCRDDEYHLQCRHCNLSFHERCAESPVEIHHPSHPRHPLTLFMRGTSSSSSHGVCDDGRCRLCRSKLKKFYYHCFLCEFSLDLACSRDPPPLHIHHAKAHEHELTLMPRSISFTCNACGFNGDRSPYVCSQCDLMVHKDCIYLPRLIRINRHEHRISHAPFLGHGEWICGVCRQKIDKKYGAFSCSVCPNYAVHSRCATSKHVWDQRELDGDSMESDNEIEEEDASPFKVITEGVISHFSHEEHDLRLEINNDGVPREDGRLCKACVLPVCSKPFYSCTRCDFALHQDCANLPRKKRHVIHPHPLTLRTDQVRGNNNNNNNNNGSFRCYACLRICNGFRYECCNIHLDVRCGAITEPFIHESHPHPLFLPPSPFDENQCKCCGKTTILTLRCVECDFGLDFKCATLPNALSHECDEHSLSLSFGEEGVTEAYWCDICEKKADPKEWLYTCEGCVSTLHTKCVFGDFSYLRPKLTLSFRDDELEAVLNDGLFRPKCFMCHSRCEVPSVLRENHHNGNFICSNSCLVKFRFMKLGL